MPNWKQVLDETKGAGSTHDAIRRKYLKRLASVTKRNVIVYYSGWLQKGGRPFPTPADFSITDADKNGFMTCVHKMDKSKGLDLVLHTPGGETAATESLVHYLRAMFGTDIRAIIPQIALSAGTMVACACAQIIMGEHSSLGPIDPQFMGIPAHGIIEEFNRAATEIQANPARIPVWQPIIAKYNPTLVGECEKAIKWSTEMAKEWLVSGMFAGDDQAAAKADRIVSELSDHSLTLSHARHISLATARQLGLKVVALEDDNALQDAVLSVHHACIQTLTETGAFKITQNQLGVAFIQAIKTAVIAGP